MDNITRPAIRFGLVAFQVTTSGVAALGSCTACAQLPIGWMGFIFYLLLLVVAAKGWSRLLFHLSVIACGTHIGLLYVMGSLSRSCDTCTIAAFGSVVLLAWLVVEQGRGIRFLWIELAPVVLIAAPGGCWMVQAPLKLSAIVQGAPNQSTQLIVYTDPECPACRLLEKDVMPAFLERHGESVAVRYVEVQTLSPAERPSTLPTVWVVRPEGRKALRGVPTVADLEAAVRM